MTLLEGKIREAKVKVYDAIDELVEWHFAMIKDAYAKTEGGQIEDLETVARSLKMVFFQRVNEAMLSADKEILAAQEEDKKLRGV